MINPARMRHIFSTLTLSCVLASGALAQENAVIEPSADTDVRPVTCAVSATLGSGKVRDTYLTPLAYEGIAYGLQAERWRTMRTLQWTSQQRFDLSMNSGDIASGNSSMLSGRLRYRYALMYGWKLDALRSTLLVGPYAGIDLGFNYNLKMASGNNPATARLCHNLGLSAAGVTHYTLRGQDCAAMLQAQAPLMGVAFVPEYGASYYETFMLQSTDDDEHFTSLHNQQDLDLRLTTDIPLAVVCKSWKTTVRLGVGYHIETMKINDITTRCSSFEFVMGWVYQYLPYSRKKAHLLKLSAYEAY